MKALCDRDDEILLHDGRRAIVRACMWKARIFHHGQYHYLVQITYDRRELNGKWGYEDYIWQSEIAGREV